MAERRMFTKKITESDAFLDMPLSTQALYFHLCMNADDDGFVNNPKRIQRMLGASEDDIKLLLAKSFTINFEKGVLVIKHWRMHNLLRKDRYKESEYADEKSMLFIKDNGVYTLDENKGENALATKWQPNGNQMAPQDSIGKDNQVSKKESKEKDYYYNSCTRTCACESYDELMNEYNVEQPVRTALYEFIKHCQINKRTVTNDKLSRLIVELDMQYGNDVAEKIAALQCAVDKGYFDIRRE